jgi:hypothetical protein
VVALGAGWITRCRNGRRPASRAQALAYVQSDEFNDIDTPTEEEKHPIDTGVEE